MTPSPTNNVAPTNGLYVDAYKASMAEAGFPLQEEVFYFSHRKGGWQYVPLDIAAFIRARLPVFDNGDLSYLEENGYRLGGAAIAAYRKHDAVTITALPKGAWFFDREPVFSVRGPSAIVSWLEDIAIQINFRIQVATAALRRELPEKYISTCNEEADIIRETLDNLVKPTIKIEVNSEKYYDEVYNRAAGLVKIVEDPNRLFEVGFRAATCIAQHRIALNAIRKAGILRTSNMGLARELGMIPVGTMGHEHPQRHGPDYAAYKAMAGRHPGFLFNLPDTYDTMLSGIPAALRCMLEAPDRDSGIRFDSEHGIVGHYLYAVNRAREVNLTPVLGLESGWNAAKTTQFEDLRRVVGWPAARQIYGYGGYIVCPENAPFPRDRVSAVYKLSQTGSRSTMKFGDEPLGGKSSIPGRPVVWRPHLGGASYSGPVGYIAQEGENWTPPGGRRSSSLLSGANECDIPVQFTYQELASRTSAYQPQLDYSPATLDLIAQCTRERAVHIAAFTQGN